jgi:predicted HAD superfamily Cof-like phosphohydrolase
MSYEDMIREFMEKHGQFQGRLGYDAFNSLMSSISPEVKELRVRLMMEELAETVTAMHEGDIPNVADGLADLVYVVIGTALAYGIPFDRIFQDVQRANMTKAPLDRNNKGGKVGKEGFVPPQTVSILEDYIKNG